MNASPSNIIVGGKSANTASSHSPSQSQFSQISSPSFETRRSSSHSTTPHASARNNQVKKKQHKNQQKPRLAVEDAMVESNSMRNSNGRRGQTSITHLMRFELPPRPQYNRENYTRARRTTYGLGSGHHAVDKARFVHANYRFIVNPNGDYRPQAVDADIHLDWSKVLQILASAESQASSCPICLSPPTASRMAKCGHIFCLPCLIRYMHSSDDTKAQPEKKARWKQCPICFDSIYVSETRPVRWYIGQENPAPQEGHDVVLRLVMRQPGSTLALPRDGGDTLAKSEDIPWYFAAEVTDYARVMKGSEDYMNEQFDEEIASLQLQEKEDELIYNEDNEWTQKAINSIRDAKERLTGIGNPPPVAKQPAEKKSKREPIQFNKTDEGVPDMYLLQHAAKSGSSGFVTPQLSDTTAGAPNTTPTAAQDIASPAQFTQQDKASSPTRTHTQTPRHVPDGHHPDEPYFFYQALLHYFLAPLDIRILKAAFGNFSTFPSTILPRVEHVSTGHVVDDELRRRTKYLAHLPYGCEVGFLECDWTDVVGPEVLEKFASEIERRRKRNKDKETREEKDRLRAEKEEDEKRWAPARRKHPSVVYEEKFTSDDFRPLAPTSLDVAGESPPLGMRQGSSFASLASPSTSPSAPRTVWGTTRISPTSPELGPQLDEGDDGWLQDWEKQVLDEDELIARTMAASLNGEGSAAASSSAGPSQGSSQGGGKKKKGKKITLMSTTARRAA